MKRRWVIPVVIVSFLMFHAGIGFAKSQPVHEEITETRTKIASAQHELIISSVAPKILLHIANARADIKEAMLDKAIENLKKADKLIKIIKDAVPTMKVKNHILVAKKHLDYEDAKKVVSDLVPIFISLDEIKDIVPVSGAKKHIILAKNALESGNKEKAKEELNKAEDSLQYLEVEFPISDTEKHLLSAIKCLELNKSKDAENDLEEAKNDVVFLSKKSSKPIVKAKESLWMASKAYAGGNYVATKTYLEKAKAYLNEAAKSGNQKKQKEIKELGEDVDLIRRNLKKNRKPTSSEVESLWERGKALVEREFEIARADWEKFRFKSNTRADLAEANLHLKYAESYQITLGNFVKAQEDLKVCNDYMKEAMKDASSQTKVKIDAIAKEINQIKMNYKNRSKEMRDKYKKVESELTDLIGTLENR